MRKTNLLSEITNYVREIKKTLIEMMNQSNRLKYLDISESCIAKNISVLLDNALLKPGIYDKNMEIIILNDFSIFEIIKYTVKG